MQADGAHALPDVPRSHMAEQAADAQWMSQQLAGLAALAAEAARRVLLGRHAFGPESAGQAGPVAHQAAAVQSPCAMNELSNADATLPP